MNLIGLPCYELQCWGSSSKGTRDVMGRAKLSGFGAIAKGAVFSHTEGLAEVIALLLNPLAEGAVLHDI